MIGHYKSRLYKVDKAMRAAMDDLEHVQIMQRRKYRESLIALSLASIKHGLFAEDLGGVRSTQTDEGSKLLFTSTLREMKQLVIDLVDDEEIDASPEYLEWGDEILHNDF